MNNNLAEYHVPVNADIGTIDVSVLNIPDKKNSILSVAEVLARSA